MNATRSGYARKLFAMMVVFVMMSVILLTPAYAETTVSTAKKPAVKQSAIEHASLQYDFGVGQGIQWPKQVNAPFIDMSAWVTKPGYSNNGAPNLLKISEDTGVTFFNLGFIQPISNQIVNGKVPWGFGGFSVLNEENANNAQYQGIKQSIRELREMGGDVTISLGGLNGITFWEVTQDTDTLFNTYMELVQGFGLTRLDLDIEGGGASNKAFNIANAKAIKKLQDATGIDIVLTLPVLPSGLTHVQLDVLEAYLANGVDVEVVNIMTMCYGSGTLQPGENYGSASLRAVDSTKDQLKQYFKHFANMDLTDQEAYGKIGTTPSIGFESAAHPIFTTEWAQWVVDHAIEKGLAMTSFWSMNRDAVLLSNAGVTTPYQFTDIFKQFGDGSAPAVHAKPVIYGTADKTIMAGDSFNPREGVTAMDREDGDLTYYIEIEGSVDSSIPGTYKLIYAVQDSQGQTAYAERYITVIGSDDTGNDTGHDGLVDTYDPNQIYWGGDTVIYKGEQYRAKWWVQGEAPDSSHAWEKIVNPNEDGSVDYVPGSVYLNGDLVRYEGKLYQAKWWTISIPGSDNSWMLIQ
ncbi:immunoglobulin-like domain-containing protein [Paenibacillus faecalis]|uniref:immunoglobulin-like domain-containing protein n=1 Tax=Paenibacillus faecalis TaxID=2079532 RepID=UPI000D0E3844|nr:immunoglobulin-like domain-containing protein [Paenibacillus faecalis]